LRDKVSGEVRRAEEAAERLTEETERARQKACDLRQGELNRQEKIISLRKEVIVSFSKQLISASENRYR
jgi:hypothetical protein